MSKLNDLIKEYCPNGVQIKKIGEVAKYRRGSFPQPYTDQRYYGGENAMPFVQVADVGENMLLVEKTKNTISEFAQPKSVFVPKGTVIVTLQGTIGRVAITQYDSYVDRTLAIFEGLNEEINTKYFAYQLQRIFGIKKKYARGSTIKTITKEEFTEFEIAVPPLEVQCEIVQILDDFTLLSAELSAELKARQKQYEYYRNKLLTFDENPETVDTLHTHTHTHGYLLKNARKILLGQVGNVCMCKRIMKNQTLDNGDIPFYKIGTFGGKANAYITKELFEEYKMKYSYPKKGSILISASGTIGRSVIYDGQPAYFQDSNIVWIDNDETIVLNKYLYYLYQVIKWKVEGGTIKRLYNDSIRNTEITIPSIEEQIKIIKILDKFDKLVNDISDGLPAEIEARQKQYEYYREKLLTFKELKVA